jgi:hypothetical protein
MSTDSHISAATPGVAQSASSKPSSSLTAVAWIPVRDIEQGEWVAVGRRLGGLVRCSQWWIGDWVRYGSARCGERYVAAARITGYDVDSLRNMVWIASHFVPARRRDNLTWSHHAALVTLDAAEQDRWLDRAVSQRLSVADLRIELRAARRGDRDVEGAGSNARATQTSDDTPVVTCPRCGLTIPIAVHPE